MTYLNSVELKHIGYTDIRHIKMAKAKAVRVEIRGEGSCLLLRVRFFKKSDELKKGRIINFIGSVSIQQKRLDPNKVDKTDLKNFNFCVIENLPVTISKDDKIFMYFDPPLFV